MKMIDTQMVMTMTLGPRERRWVTNRPQTIFKAHGLSYNGPIGTFKLLDILVGKNTQLSIGSSHDGLSMEMFSEPNKIQELSFETCQVAMDFKLLIENVSSREAAFECIVHGVEPVL